VISEDGDLDLEASVDPDLRAAEYVLGSLDVWDRAEVTRQAATDARMADRIRAWERRLTPLLDAIPSVAPRWNLQVTLLRTLLERSE
jgi:anti-sigma-K factor RskA